MDEIIVRVMRTLACQPRLRMLSCLAREQELAPTALAAELHMSLGRVCTHLASLASAGLIQRRRSGVWSYGVARSPYSESTLSGRLGRWLFGLLKDPERATRNCRVPELRNNFPDVHALLFHAATAFTNVRRLRVLRRLAATKTVTAESLSEELHMSSSAVSRHLIKLIRRGFAQTVPGRWPLAYELARQFKTPIHAEMLAIVRSSWTKKESRQ